MGLFHVDVVTERGVRRAPFTLDEARPLTPQLRHVLEELRQSGVILKGGPEDQLVVRWNGRDLDTELAPRALAISSLYPIELKMVRREFVEARKEPPPRPFLPKGDYIGALTGATGAVVAWVIASLLTDLGGLPSYDQLDLVTAALLGGATGSCVMAGYAMRRGESILAGFLIGMGLGTAGAGLGAFVALMLTGFAGLGDSRQGFALARVITWALMAGGLGTAVGLRWVRRDSRRAIDGLLGGLVAGGVAGLAYSLPGRPEFWQALAFVLVGAGVGFALNYRGARRSLGILALETVANRSVGLMRHREWEIPRDAVTWVAGPLRVESKGARCTVAVEDGESLEGLMLGGRPLRGATTILNEDMLVLGDRAFRFRRFGGYQ